VSSDAPIISDKLRLEEEIGRGAMGVVWRARNLALDSSVAVKVLAGADLDETQEGRQRFEREARAVARLSSPYIVQVFDYGLDEGRPYFVMELLEGEDLGQRLERDQCLPLMMVQQIVEQVCRGLTVAHEAGIVHRDLKPANLFLLGKPDQPIHIKILDFGVAKQLDPPEKGMTMTQSGTLVGTPFYMSPEQILAPREIDERTDLWSLAVVVFTMLTGAVPFDGETIGALSIAIHQGAFTPPSKLRDGLPPAIDAWFERAFQQMPDDRFGSAEELAISFTDACRNRAPHVLAVTHGEADEQGAATERAPQGSASRGRARRALAVGLVVLGAVGGAVATRQLGETEVAEPTSTSLEPSSPRSPQPLPPPVVVPSATATPRNTSWPLPTATPAPPPTSRRVRPKGPPTTLPAKPSAQARLNLGTPCTDGGQCKSAHCVDGVCCNQACHPRSACYSCTQAQRRGTPLLSGFCGPALPGTNPRGRCIGFSVCDERALCVPRRPP